LPPTSAYFFVGLLFDPEDGGDTFLRNATLPELHGVASQNTILVIVTDVRISNLKH
jgi:hypothetical protein